jgi:hypothetical protein
LQCVICTLGGTAEVPAVRDGLGGDPQTYARQAGASRRGLDTDELLVDDTAMAAVLELAAVDLGCLDLGATGGEMQGFRMLGPLSVAMQNSPSVSEAIEFTSRGSVADAALEPKELVMISGGTMGVY